MSFFFFLENQENYFICTQSQCYRRIFEDRWKSKKTNIFYQYLNTLEKYETSLRIDETFGGMEHQVQLENFMVGRLAEFQGRNGNDRNSFCRVSLFVRSFCLTRCESEDINFCVKPAKIRGRGDVERGQIAVEIGSEEEIQGDR